MANEASGNDFLNFRRQIRQAMRTERMILSTSPEFIHSQVSMLLTSRTMPIFHPFEKEEKSKAGSHRNLLPPALSISSSFFFQDADCSIIHDEGLDPNRVGNRLGSAGCIRSSLCSLSKTKTNGNYRPETILTLASTSTPQVHTNTIHNNEIICQSEWEWRTKWQRYHY